MTYLEKRVFRLWFGASIAVLLALAVKNMQERISGDCAAAVHKVREDLDNLRCEILDGRGKV
jgi:hypothetical protein